MTRRYNFIIPSSAVTHDLLLLLVVREEEEEEQVSLFGVVQIGNNRSRLRMGNGNLEVQISSRFIGQLCCAELLNKHIMWIAPFMRMKFMEIWRPQETKKKNALEEELYNFDISFYVCINLQPRTTRVRTRGSLGVVSGGLEGKGRRRRTAVQIENIRENVAKILRLYYAQSLLHLHLHMVVKYIGHVNLRSRRRRRRTRG